VSTALEPLGRALRAYRDRAVLERSATEFRLALARAMRIQGFTSPIELSFLYHAVLALPGDGRVVEIGSYLGRSTAVLAHAVAQAERAPAVAVDPHTGDLTVAGRPEDTHERFLQNMRAAGISPHVHPIHATSVAAAAAWTGEPVELLFVDGLHTHEAVVADVESWSPFLTAGACVVFDDYLVYPDVRAALREVRAAGRIRGTAVVVGKMIAFAGNDLLARLPTPPFARTLARLPERSINPLNRLLDRALV
jgi:predicted O-methyltransferase YrrM